MTNPYLSETDVLADLASLDTDTLEERIAERQEWLRLLLTGAMIQARQQRGLTQTAAAALLGRRQAWVSKLENANYDHTLDSVVAYLTALDAELDISVLQEGQVYPVSHARWLLAAQVETQTFQARPTQVRYRLPQGLTRPDADTPEDPVAA